MKTGHLLAVLVRPAIGVVLSSTAATRGTRASAMVTSSTTVRATATELAVSGEINYLTI